MTCIRIANMIDRALCRSQTVGVAPGLDRRNASQASEVSVGEKLPHGKIRTLNGSPHGREIPRCVGASSEAGRTHFLTVSGIRL